MSLGTMLGIGAGASLLAGGLLARKQRKAGRRAADALFAEAERLRNFTPLRVKNVLGSATYSKEGLDLALDPRLTAGAEDALTLFGNTARQLRDFDEEAATARTLGLLRQRRAEQYEPQLAALESRLMAQGRLGLGTGARAANPEMASFFGAEAMADLEAQLQAAEEARRTRQGMMQTASAALGLGSEASLPSGLFAPLMDLERTRLAREQAASNLFSAGAQTQLKGELGYLDTLANLFGSGVSGFLGALGKSSSGK